MDKTRRPQNASSQTRFSWLAKKSSYSPQCKSEFGLQLKPDDRLASLSPLFDLMGLFRLRCGMWGNHRVLFVPVVEKSSKCHEFPVSQLSTSSPCESVSTKRSTVCLWLTLILLNVQYKTCKTKKKYQQVHS